jgi:hypothetical protein
MTAKDRFLKAIDTAESDVHFFVSGLAESGTPLTSECFTPIVESLWETAYQAGLDLGYSDAINTSPAHPAIARLTSGEPASEAIDILIDLIRDAVRQFWSNPLLEPSQEEDEPVEQYIRDIECMATIQMAQMYGIQDVDTENKEHDINLSCHLLAIMASNHGLHAGNEKATNELKYSLDGIIVALRDDHPTSDFPLEYVTLVKIILDQMVQTNPHAGWPIAPKVSGGPSIAGPLPAPLQAFKDAVDYFIDETPEGSDFRIIGAAAEIVSNIPLESLKDHRDIAYLARELSDLTLKLSEYYTRGEAH